MCVIVPLLLFQVFIYISIFKFKVVRTSFQIYVSLIIVKLRIRVSVGKLTYKIKKEYLTKSKQINTQNTPLRSVLVVPGESGANEKK